MLNTSQLVLPAQDQGASNSMLFIGNATLLIEYGGFTLLTDPTFVHRHEQVSIGYGLHTTRLTDPAMEITDLPPIDLVVLSHFHGDHFDQVAERELDRTLPIVTTPEAAEALSERGFSNAYPLATWETVRVSKGTDTLAITAAPGRHGPPLVDFALPDVMGSIIDFGPEQAPSLRMYITGDTLAVEELAEIPRRYPDIDVAILHLGGTRVMGVTVTMDGEQGTEAIRVVEPRVAIPIHYDDYDVFKSPLSEFESAVIEAGLDGRVRYLERGERLALDDL